MRKISKIVIILFIFIFFCEIFINPLLLKNQIDSINHSAIIKNSLEVGGDYTLFETNDNAGEFTDWVTTPPNGTQYSSTKYNWFDRAFDNSYWTGGYQNYGDRLYFYSDTYGYGQFLPATIEDIFLQGERDVTNIRATHVTDWNCSYRLSYQPDSTVIYPRRIRLRFQVIFTDGTLITAYFYDNEAVTGLVDFEEEISMNFPDLIESILGVDPSTKIIDFFRIQVWIRGVDFGFILYSESLSGYTPTIKNWEIQDQIIKQQQDYYYFAEMYNFSSDLTDSTTQTDGEVQFRFIETGNSIGINLQEDWTQDGYYYEWYALNRLGYYAYKYVAQNEWGIVTETPELEVLVSDITFPKTSYLNVRSYEYRDIPEELFFIYLGDSESITLFDFKPEGVGYGNWVIMGNANYTLGYERVIFSGIYGGIKSDFSHLQAGIQYGVGNVSLEFDLKTNFSELVIIGDPTGYDYDYLLELEPEYLNQWVTVIIPFYMFQNFPSANGFIGELGFYSFYGTYQIANIKLATFHNSSMLINYTAQDYNTTEAQSLNTSSIFNYTLIPTISNQASYSNWNNYSAWFNQSYLLQSQTLNTSALALNNTLFNSQIATWDNFSAWLNNTYNLQAETLNTSQLASYSQLYYSSISQWDNFSAWLNNTYNLQAETLNTSQLTSYSQLYYSLISQWNNYSAWFNNSYNLYCNSYLANQYDNYSNIFNSSISQWNNYTAWLNNTYNLQCDTYNTSQFNSSAQTFDSSISQWNNYSQWLNNSYNLNCSTNLASQTANITEIVGDNSFIINTFTVIDDFTYDGELHNNSGGIWSYAGGAGRMYANTSYCIANESDITYADGLYSPNITIRYQNWYTIESGSTFTYNAWGFGAGVNFIYVGWYLGSLAFYSSNSGGSTLNTIPYTSGTVLNLTIEWLSTGVANFYINDEFAFRHDTYVYTGLMILGMIYASAAPPISPTYVDEIDRITSQEFSVERAFNFNYTDKSHISSLNLSSIIETENRTIDYSFYNFTSGFYQLFTPVELNGTLDLDYFNGTQVLLKVNSTERFNDLPLNFNLTLNYWIYENTSFLYYYDLNYSSYYFLHNFMLNQTINLNSNITFQWSYSGNNISWSAWETDLSPEGYGDRYLRYQINLTTANQWNTSHFYGAYLNFTYENITAYSINQSLILTFSWILKANIWNISAFGVENSTGSFYLGFYNFSSAAWNYSLYTSPINIPLSLDYFNETTILIRYNYTAYPHFFINLSFSANITYFLYQSTNFTLYEELNQSSFYYYNYLMLNYSSQINGILIDDFNDGVINASLWSTWGSPFEMNGVLILNATGVWGDALMSVSTNYSTIGTKIGIWGKLIQNSTTWKGMYFSVNLGAAGNLAAGFIYSNNTLFSAVVSNVTLPSQNLIIQSHTNINVSNWNFLAMERYNASAFIFYINGINVGLLNLNSTSFPDNMQLNLQYNILPIYEAGELWLDDFYLLNSNDSFYSNLLFNYSYSSDNSSWSTPQSCFFGQNLINGYGNQYLRYQINITPADPFYTPIFHSAHLFFEFQNITQFGVDSAIQLNYSYIYVPNIQTINYNAELGNESISYLERFFSINGWENGTGTTGTHENTHIYITPTWSNPLQSSGSATEIAMILYFNVSNILGASYDEMRVQSVFQAAPILTKAGSYWIFNYTSNSWVKLLDITSSSIHYTEYNFSYIESLHFINQTSGEMQLKLMSGYSYVGFPLFQYQRSTTYYYSDIEFHKYIPLGFYNFTSDSYDYYNFSFPIINYNLNSDYFNSTHILTHLNYTAYPHFYLNITLSGNISYILYQNTSYLYYYELDYSTYYYNHYFLLNTLINDNSNLTFQWSYSGNNISWSAWETDLSPEGYGDRYLRYQINLTTANQWNTSHLYGAYLNLTYENITAYSINETIAFPFNYIQLDHIWNISVESQINTTENFILGFYNFTSTAYNYSQYLSPADFSLSSDYFNGTHILMKVNYSSYPEFSLNCSFQINITYWIYENTSFLYYYGLNYSSYYFYHNFTLNQTINLNSNVTFQWSYSGNNITWSAWETDLSPEGYGNQYLRYQINFTSYQWNTSHFYNSNLYFSYYNGTEYSSNISLIYNYSFIDSNFIQYINFTYENVLYNDSQDHNLTAYYGVEQIQYPPASNPIQNYFNATWDNITDILYEWSLTDYPNNETTHNFTLYFNLSQYEIPSISIRFLNTLRIYAQEIPTTLSLKNFETNSFDTYYSKTDLFFNYYNVDFSIENITPYVNDSKILILRLNSGWDTNPFFNTSYLNWGYSALEIYKKLAIGFYNFTNSSYSYSYYLTNNTNSYSLPLDYFNGTHILMKVNYTNYPEFSYNASFGINITYWIYENTSFLYYYNLNYSSFYFYYNFTLNQTINLNSNITFQWSYSGNNISWSAWETDLSPEIYGNQYLRYQINFTSNQWNTSNFYGAFLYFNYNNITLYSINETIAFPFNYIQLDHIWNISVESQINTTENFILGFYNFTSTAYNYSQYLSPADFSLSTDYFNQSYILMKVNYSSYPEFSLNCSFQINITYWIYENTSFIYYYNLNSSTVYYFYNFTLNYSQLLNTNVTFYWQTSADNSSWSTLSTDLNINAYGEQYLRYQINLNVTNPYFNTSYFYNTDLFFEYQNITFYYIYEQLNTTITNLVFFLNATLILNATHNANIINSSISLYNYSSLNYDNISTLQNINYLLPLNYNSSEGLILINITLVSNTSFYLNCSGFVKVYNSDFYKYIYFNITEDLSMLNFNEISFWYNFSDSRCQLYLEYYNDSWNLISTFNSTPLNYGLGNGAYTSRFSQYWNNITEDNNYTSIRFLFVLNNPTSIDENITVQIKRFELIEYVDYRLESEENRQRYDILIFQQNLEYLLIIDFAGREIYRQEVEYSEFIDIFLNIAEINLDNNENYTVWFAFESRGVTVEYAVPPYSSRSIIILLGDYLVNIYDDTNTILQVREVSITTTNKTTIRWGEDQPITIPDFPSRTLWDIAGEAIRVMFIWFTTDPLGIFVFVLIDLVIFYYILRWYRRRKKTQEKTVKKQFDEGYEKGYKDALKGIYKGKRLPRKKVQY